MVAMARVMEVVASNTSKRKGNVELKPIVLETRDDGGQQNQPMVLLVGVLSVDDDKKRDCWNGNAPIT